MKADETEKDWKRRCFNEQQLPICSGSLPRYVHRRYFAVLHRSAVGTAEEWQRTCASGGVWEVVRACGLAGRVQRGGCQSDGTLRCWLG